MYLKVQGLVLRITPYKDNDALLTVLTNQYGKLTVKARGLRKKNSPLVAPCQLLAFGEFMLFEYKGMYTINEAVSVQLFQNLRTDLTKLSLATYFAQVAELVSQEDMSNPELLSLVLNCLHTLSTTDISQELVKAVYELRCACIAGYMPDLSGCLRCGAQYPDRFNISQGILECSGCRDYGVDGIRMPLLPGALDAMRYICYCDGKKLFGFQIGQESVQILSQLTESYLCTQLERGFSTLDFYKSLFITT